MDPVGIVHGVVPDKAGNDPAGTRHVGVAAYVSRERLFAGVEGIRLALDDEPEPLVDKVP